MAVCERFQFTNFGDRSFINEDFEDDNYCSWCSEYVACNSCNEDDEDIIVIDISTFTDGLTGVLDFRDAWPSNLETLDISAPQNSRNKLTGSWDWSPFTNKMRGSLKRLAISYHEFEGEIGSSKDWDIIADLEEFECAGCLLEGDLSKLNSDSSLRVLNLWDTPVRIAIYTQIVSILQQPISDHTRALA